MSGLDGDRCRPGIQAYIDKNNAYLAQRSKYIRDVVSDEEAKIVEENIWSFINAYQIKSDVIEGVPDEILNKIIEQGTSASTIAEIDREVERMREFERNGLTEIAIRIYENPADSIRLIGEKIAPALKD